ncbi:GMC oxidoreductase [Mycena floridula]|nr:GMC oxidoreductase [Mycena floridula]
MGIPYSKQTVSNVSRVATLVAGSPASDKPDGWKSYDYVIVGGGTAGSVLASRLSEDRNITVLVIEPGKTHQGDLLTAIPLAFSKLFKSEVDWDYATTPQKVLNGRAIPIPQGKILGGTSSINCLIYDRCASSDFDEWARLGATGWAYKDILPYFLKAESYSSTVRARSEHGTKGPWQVGEQRCIPAPIHQTLLTTAQNLNMPYVVDPSSATAQLGSTEFLTFTDRSGKRSSAAAAYLTPSVLSRSNLTVLTRAVTEKVLFSAGQSPRAIGVEISSSVDGPRYRVRASKEVLICAGAIASPQLLLLSGIGPKEELKKHGIEGVLDHPAMGKHLRDHPSCGTLILRTKASEKLTWDYLGNPLSGLFAMVKWFVTGGGPMAGLALPGGAFIRSDDSLLRAAFTANGEIAPVEDNTSGPHAPDLELIWTPIIVLDNGKGKPPAGVTGISMGAMAMRPMSEGSITLKTSSIWDKPEIDPNYLSVENDMNVLIRAVRIILRMANTEPLRSVIELSEPDKDMPWLYPGNKDPESLQITDDELREWIRRNAMATWHPVSTARMGQDIKSSVVDVELKVHGVTGLRVIDASVFPNQVSGHPCAVVIAVAERASDIIKGVSS